MLVLRIRTLYFLTTVNICSKACSALHLDRDQRYCTIKNCKAYYSDRKNMGDKYSTSKKGSKPKTLGDFGYHFVEVDGATRLRNKDNNKPFEFDIYNGNSYMNQQRYEAIGEIITECVYKRLEEDLKLEKVTIPVNAKEKEGKGFFFKSTDALQAEKLLVLIHGSGVVRAGQWARSLIINDSWDSGTMEPYIIQAQKKGFGIIITNGNHNFDPIARKTIKGSENPEHHMLYVWKSFISDCKAKHIAVVAHSYGGVVLHHLIRTIPASMKLIKAVAFTDSVHSLRGSESKNIQTWFKKTTRNWVSSTKPLDEPIWSYRDSDCELVSAGIDEHVWTSYFAKDSVFKFINEKLHAPNNCTKDDVSVPMEVVEKTDNSDKSQVQIADESKQQSTGDSQVQSADESKEQSVDDSQVQIVGASQEQSTDDSQVQSTGDSQEQNTGDSQEQSADDSQVQSAGASQEQSADDSQEQSAGASQVQSAGASQEQSADDSQVQSAGASQVQSAGASQEQNAGASQEQSAGASQEQNAGASQEQSAGTSQEQSAGASQVQSAGASQVQSAGASQEQSADEVAEEKTEIKENQENIK